MLMNMIFDYYVVFGVFFMVMLLEIKCVYFRFVKEYYFDVVLLGCLDD